MEPAFEANESAVNLDSKKSTLNHQNVQNSTPKLVKVPAGSIPPLKVQSSIPRNTISREAECKREIVRKLKHENEQFEIQISQHDDGQMEEMVRKKLNNTDTNSKARYEIPDINLSRTAAKILGNRKELEMHEFSASKKAAQQQHCDGNKKEWNVDPTGDRQPMD